MIKTTKTMTTLESDTEPLFRDGKSKRSCSGKCWFLTSLTTAVFLGLFLAGYNYYWKDVVSIRVMSYNTWGMPSMLSLDKEERMKRIGKMLSHGEYDIVLLEELWVRTDHTTIRESVQGHDYYMTGYDDFNDVDGSAALAPAPWGCSGLAIISRWPFLQKNFTKFTQQGRFGNLLSDGEYLAGKGVGKVTIAPKEDITVDVFVTHTISEDGNYEIRENQADELVDQVKKSTADFVILGGDFNASPMMDFDKTYNKVKEVMTDAFQEIMANINAWLNDEFSTYANPRNTYTGGKEDLKPVIYDYIFHKKNTEKVAMIWTKWFYLPFLKAVNQNQTFSLSDHEAVTSHLYLWKQTN